MVATLPRYRLPSASTSLALLSSAIVLVLCTIGSNGEEFYPTPYKLETRFSGQLGWWPVATPEQEATWSAEWPRLPQRPIHPAHKYPYQLPDSCVFLAAPFRNDIMQVKEKGFLFSLMFFVYNFNMTEGGARAEIFYNDQRMEPAYKNVTNIGFEGFLLPDGTIRGGRHSVDVVLVDADGEETGVGASAVFYVDQHKDVEAGVTLVSGSQDVLPNFGTGAMVVLLHPRNQSSVRPRDGMRIEYETPGEELPPNGHVELSMDGVVLGTSVLGADGIDVDSKLLTLGTHTVKARYMDGKNVSWSDAVHTFECVQSLSWSDQADEGSDGDCDRDTVWGTCSDDPEKDVKYIGYSDFWGRGNNRRVWLLHAIALAHLLNRTLVLPEEYTLLGLRIYDFSRITELAPVVTAHQFFWERHIEGTATMVCSHRPCFYRPGWLMPLERNSYGREIVTAFKYVDQTKWKTLDDVKAGLGGLQDKFIDVNLALDAIPFPSLDHPLYLWAAGSLPFRKDIDTLAKEWTRQTFGEDKFLCMVWRRNDFKEFCDHNVKAGLDCFQTIDYTAQRVMEETQRFGVHRMYVTTDGNRTERKQLIEEIGKRGGNLQVTVYTEGGGSTTDGTGVKDSGGTVVATSMAGGEVEDEDGQRSFRDDGAMFAAPPVWGEVPRDVVEQAICTRSYAVLLNRWSSFGGTILGIRRAHGVTRDAAF